MEGREKLSEKSRFSMRPLIPLYLASFLVDETQAILVVAVPIYAYRIGASPMIIGLMGGVGGLAYTLMAVASGRISDKVDKRILLSISVLLQSAISFAFSLSTNNVSLILLSGLRSASVGMFWPNIENLLVEKIQPAYLDKALSGFNTSWSIGWIVGPFIGGALIEVFSPQTAFYAGVLFPLIAIALVAFSGSKRIQEKRPREELKADANVVVILKELSMFYATVFMMAFCQTTINTLFPTLAISLKISALEIGSILLFIGLARTLIFSQGSILIRHLEKRTLMILGITLITVSSIITAFGIADWHFVSGMIFLGIGYGISYLTTISAILSGEDSNRGLRAGLFEGILGFGSIIGPILGGALSEIDMKLPYPALALVASLFIIYQLMGKMNANKKKLSE